MIKIGKPYIVESEGKAYLKARIDIPSETAMEYTKVKDKLPGLPWRFYEDYPPSKWQRDDSGLWYCVDAEYKDCLCAERSDAFVVAMLWYALVTGSDLSFETPISEKLFFGITYMLLPVFEEKGEAAIKLIGPTAAEGIPNKNAVGTGLSCGVDSLYTLKKYTDPGMPEAYRLTHTVYFETGNITDLRYTDRNSDRLPLSEFYARTREIAAEKIRNAREAANEAGLPLIAVTSNIDEDYYRGGSGVTYILRYCSGILALSGLFRLYYISSTGYTSSFIGVDLYGEPDDYELLLEKNLSGNSMEFRLSDYVCRGTKIAAIADFETAKKHLDVCFNYCSCGECRKCIRTMLTLDARGVLDRFEGSFDLKKYRKERRNIIAKYDVISSAPSNPFERLSFQEVRTLAGEYNKELAEEIDSVLNSFPYKTKKMLRPARLMVKKLIKKV